MKKLITIVLLGFLATTGITRASFDVNIKYGTKKSEPVKEMQEFLVDQNCLTGNATGNFYALTLKAVKCFQRANNLKTTGYWDLNTRTVANGILQADLADSDTDSANEVNAPTDPTPTQVVIAPTTTPVVDWCLNLVGNQATIPDGMARDSYSNCITSPFTPTYVYVNSPTPPTPPAPVAPALPEGSCTITATQNAKTNGFNITLVWTTQNLTTTTPGELWTIIGHKGSVDQWYKSGYEVDPKGGTYDAANHPGYRLVFGDTSCSVTN